VSTAVLDCHDGVGVVTIQALETKNAMSHELMADLIELYTRAADDPAVAVVLTRADGDRYWCTGATQGDIDNATLDPDAIDRDWAMKILHLDKPLIAAVNGWAVSGGLALALLHDVRIASNRARFASGFVSAGLGPEHALTWLLSQAVGRSVAADLLLSGRAIDATEAYRLGLASQLVDASQLDATALAYATAMSRHPAAALRATKQALKAAASAAAEVATLEWANQGACFEWLQGK
jgi:enoyl-CoA hydratase/carnithine racemase